MGHFQVRKLLVYQRVIIHSRNPTWLAGLYIYVLYIYIYLLLSTIYYYYLLLSIKLQEGTAKMSICCIPRVQRSHLGISGMRPSRTCHMTSSKPPLEGQKGPVDCG